MPSTKTKITAVTLGVVDVSDALSRYNITVHRAGMSRKAPNQLRLSVVRLRGAAEVLEPPRLEAFADLVV